MKRPPLTEFDIRRGRSRTCEDYNIHVRALDDAGGGAQSRPGICASQYFQLLSQMHDFQPELDP
jgi:hypothetical protein